MTNIAKFGDSLSHFFLQNADKAKCSLIPALVQDEGHNWSKAGG